MHFLKVAKPPSFRMSFFVAVVSLAQRVQSDNNKDPNEAHNPEAVAFTGRHKHEWKLFTHIGGVFKRVKT